MTEKKKGEGRRERPAGTYSSSFEVSLEKALDRRQGDPGERETEPRERETETGERETETGERSNQRISRRREVGPESISAHSHQHSLSTHQTDSYRDSLLIDTITEWTDTTVHSPTAKPI